MQPLRSLVPSAKPDDDTLDAQLSTMRRREARHAHTIWEPASAGEPAAAADAVAIPIEAAIIEAIVRPIEPGEMHRAGNDRKERELLALLDTLTPVQALALRRRLANGRAGDPMVAAFARLIAERRNRVLAFLDDARRRAARRATR